MKLTNFNNKFAMQSPVEDRTGNRKVSIVIPTFNQSRYIEKTVRSALMQTYENLEVLVVDDASVDDTREILLQFISNSKFKYFRNEKNIGRVKNYRKGLEYHATGDFILNLDGDDYLTDRNFIKNAANFLNSNQDVGLYIANCISLFDGHDECTVNSTQLSIEKVIDGIQFVENFFYGKQFFYHLSSLYRRMDAIRLDFYMNDSVWTDGISLFKLACTTKVAVSTKVVGVWRIHGENESRKFHKRAKFDEIFEVVDYISSLKPTVSTRSANYFRYINAYSFIVFLLKSGDLRRLKEFFFYIVKNKPYIFKRYGFTIILRILLNGIIYFKRNYLK